MTLYSRIKIILGIAGILSIDIEESLSACLCKESESEKVGPVRLFSDKSEFTDFRV